MRIKAVFPDVLMAVILAVVLICVIESGHQGVFAQYPYVLGIVCYGLGRGVSIVQSVNRSARK